MPSVQVANKDWNREVKKVDRPIVKQQNQEVVGEYYYLSICAMIM